MNTTINAVLYTSKRLSNGEHPLVLRLTKGGKRKYLSLHLSLDPKFWDFDKNRPRKNCPNRDQINRLIEQKIGEYQEYVYPKNPFFTLSRIDFFVEIVCEYRFLL